MKVGDKMDQLVQNTENSLDNKPAVLYNDDPWQHWDLYETIEWMHEQLFTQLKKRYKQKYNTRKPIPWAIVQSRKLVIMQTVGEIIETHYDEMLLATR
jgi:hypothetical protein